MQETGERGMLTLHTALVNSCNTVFYELGYELGNRTNLLPDMTKAYGLGAPTGIPICRDCRHGSQSGVEDRQYRRLLGHGITIQPLDWPRVLEATPLQMANVYATIANGTAICFSRSSCNRPFPKMARPKWLPERTVIRHLPLERLDDRRAAKRAA
ncbi:MAG: penicillin-binding transpeptidase domain-containing protein [Thermomicrobiales bacterium]